MIIEALKSLLIGIVEGVTEWLPISSTGHMILVDDFVQLQVSPEFLALFLVVIQIGAILAVLTLYFHKLNPLSPRKNADEKRATWRLWGMVVSDFDFLPKEDRLDGCSWYAMREVFALHQRVPREQVDMVALFPDGRDFTEVFAAHPIPEHTPAEAIELTRPTKKAKAEQ